MKATMIKRSVAKLFLVIAFIFASVSDTLAAFPDLLDKRTNGEVSLTFYVVFGIIAIIAIIIALATSREENPENKNA